MALVVLQHVEQACSSGTEECNTQFTFSQEAVSNVAHHGTQQACMALVVLQHSAQAHGEALLPRPGR